MAPSRARGAAAGAVWAGRPSAGRRRAAPSCAPRPPAPSIVVTASKSRYRSVSGRPPAGSLLGRELPAQLGHEPPELLELEAETLVEPVQLPAQHDVGDQVHERLVGHERLLVGPPVEHDRSDLVGLAREGGAKARLADAGLTGEQHEAALGAGGGELAPQHPERLFPPDERAILRPEQPGLQPRPRLGDARNGAGHLGVLLVRRREHLLVERAQRGGGRRAELIAQQHSQPLEGLKRLGVVSARLVCSHEERVAGLAERRELHELARGQLGAGGAVVADGERGIREHLEGRQPVLLLPAPVLLEPGRVEERDEWALVDVERGLRSGAGLLGSAGSAARAFSSALAATSTSTIASGGSSSRSSERPCSSSAPSARRMPERSVLSVAAGSRGTAAGHSAPISSSRVTGRCRFRTRKASSALPSRPGSRPSTRAPPTSSRTSPRSWIVIGRLSCCVVANSPKPPW